MTASTSYHISRGNKSPRREPCSGVGSVWAQQGRLDRKRQHTPCAMDHSSSSYKGYQVLSSMTCLSILAKAKIWHRAGPATWLLSIIRASHWAYNWFREAKSPGRLCAKFWLSLISIDKS